MKILVYSDVHGNLPAFEKVLLNEGSCDLHICLGDLVNYGPWSNECVDLALSLKNSIILKGNHEKLFLDTSLLNNECSLVKSFFSITYPSFKNHDLINSFGESFRLNEWFFSHTINDKKIYFDTKVNLSSNSFIGHSHHQFINIINGYKLVNTGSVGQNRKSINTVNYVIYNSESGIIELKSTTFDLQLLIDEMVKVSYPKECIEYYLKKL